MLCSNQLSYVATTGETLSEGREFYVKLTDKSTTAVSESWKIPPCLASGRRELLKMPGVIPKGDSMVSQGWVLNLVGVILEGDGVGHHR